MIPKPVSRHYDVTDILLGMEDEILEWMKGVDMAGENAYDWSEHPTMDKYLVDDAIMFMVEALGEKDRHNCYVVERTLPVEFEEVLWHAVNLVGVFYGDFTEELAEFMSYGLDAAECWEVHGQVMDETVMECACTNHNQWHKVNKGERPRQWRRDGSGCTDAAIARVAAKKAQAKAKAEAEAAMGMYI